MNQGIYTFLAHVCVRVEIEPGIKFLGRVAPLFPTDPHEVPERVHIRNPHIGIGTQIVNGVKQPASIN
jgi:hypothetical protein